MFSQALRDTLEQFPDIVVSELIRFTATLEWLVAEKEGASPKLVVEPNVLKMTPSQMTSIKAGWTDPRGRSIEGIGLALYLYSHNSGNDAFGFYLRRVVELLVQRGQDAVNSKISLARREMFRDVIQNRSGQGKQEFSRALLLMVESELQRLPRIELFTIQDLLESEFIARGLDPASQGDRQRFVGACQALGMKVSAADIDSTLAGNLPSKTLLGRLRNVLMKNRLTGQLYSLEELEQIRDGKLAPT